MENTTQLANFNPTTVATFKAKDVKDALRAKGFSGKDLTREYYKTIRAIAPTVNAGIVEDIQQGWGVKSVRVTKSGDKVVTYTPPTIEHELMLATERAAKLQAMLDELTAQKNAQTV